MFGKFTLIYSKLKPNQNWNTILFWRWLIFSLLVCHNSVIKTEPPPSTPSTPSPSSNQQNDHNEESKGFDETILHESSFGNQPHFGTLGSSSESMEAYLGDDKWKVLEYLKNSRTSGDEYWGTFTSHRKEVMDLLVTPKTKVNAEKI